MDKSNLRDLREPKELVEVEFTEVTNMFEVENEGLFLKIVNRIDSKNGAIVIKDNGKVGLFSYDSILKCIPLDVPDDRIPEYDGQVEETLPHLQSCLSSNEEIILYSTSYNKRTKEVKVEVVRITKDRVEPMSIN